MESNKFIAEVKQEKNDYYKNWRKSNPDKVKKNNQRYWEKRTARKILSKKS